MKNLKKILYLITIVLVVLFIIMVIIDYIERDSLVTIDFPVSVKIRCLEFLIPALILFLVALFIKFKQNKK